MAEDRELTPKEKALVALGGKDPREPEKPAEEGGDDDKAKAEAAEKARLEKEAADKEKADKEKNKNPEETKLPELTDEQLLELASKKAGRPITSWDEFKPKKTDDDIKKEQEVRDAQKLSYGLQKGLFNRNTYESFIQDSKDAVGVVYRAELAAAKNDDPEWDEEKEQEFQEEFKERFGLELDKTASKYKSGQRQLSALADNILKSTYAPIYSLDSEYDKYEQGINHQKTNEQKILQEAPVFKQNIEDVLASHATVEITMGGEKFPVAVPKESIDAVRELLLEEKFVSSQILNGKNNKEHLASVAYNLIVTQNLNALSFEAAKKYHEKHQKGVRGIIQHDRLDKDKGDAEANMTDNQKAALQLMREQQKQTIAN